MRRITTLFFLACLFGLIAVAFSATKEEKPQHTLSAPAWEQVGRQALRRVNWDWKSALDGWSMRFGPGRPGYRGLTEFSLRRITIWIRPADQPESVAGIIVHELAHAFDRRYLTPALRSKWLAARNFSPDTPWYFPVGHLSSDYLSGAGDFAESVSWTLQGPTAGFRSCLGLSLTEKQKQLIAKGCGGLPPDKATQALIREWLVELPRIARTGGK
jgi:hypothetical protein